MFTVPPPPLGVRSVNMQGGFMTAPVLVYNVAQPVYPNNFYLDMLSVFSPIIEAIHDSLKADIAKLHNFAASTNFPQAIAASSFIPATRTYASVARQPAPPPCVSSPIITSRVSNDTQVAGASRQAIPQQQEARAEWRKVLRGPKQLSMQEKCDLQLKNRFEKLNNLYSEKFAIKYKSDDIFNCNSSIVHCVATDFNMGSGFALEVRERYGHQAKLRAMKIKKGRTANVPVGENFIFYLCTKWRSYHLPDLVDLTRCLYHLKAQCKILGVQRLAMPRIGTQNDNLQWSDVSSEITKVFQDSDIEVTVYDLPEAMAYHAAAQSDPSPQYGKAPHQRPRPVAYQPPTSKDLEAALLESLDDRKKKRRWRKTYNTPDSACSPASNGNGTPSLAVLSPQHGKTPTPRPRLHSSVTTNLSELTIPSPKVPLSPSDPASPGMTSSPIADPPPLKVTVLLPPLVSLPHSSNSDLIESSPPPAAQKAPPLIELSPDMPGVISPPPANLSPHRDLTPPAVISPPIATPPPQGALDVSATSATVTPPPVDSCSVCSGSLPLRRSTRSVTASRIFDDSGQLRLASPRAKKLDFSKIKAKILNL